MGRVALQTGFIVAEVEQQQGGFQAAKYGQLWQILFNTTNTIQITQFIKLVMHIDETAWYSVWVETIEYNALCKTILFQEKSII